MSTYHNSTNEQKEQRIGLVKWFNSDKGFGVIGTPDDGEYFLHISNFSGIPINISQGTPIIFSPRNDRNRNTAGKCRLVGQLEDWKTLLYYLGKSDRVHIQVEVFRGKEIHTFSLVELSTSNIFRGKSKSDIVNTITDYFDNYLDKNKFVTYCEFIENRKFSTEILNEIFTYFGQNLNELILFQTWKSKKFKFISYTEFDEYEIPEAILKTYVDDIGVSELIRIKDYNFGLMFCHQFVANKFKNIESFNSDELKDLYQFLEFENQDKREKLKYKLDSLYIYQITTELIKQANSFETIKSEFDINNYNNLKKFIPDEFNEENKNIIKNELNKIIVSKSSDTFLPDLWLKGYVEKISIESISKFFCNESTNDNKKAIILSRITVDQQFELLKAYSVGNNFERVFALIEQFVGIDYFHSYFCISQVLLNPKLGENKRYKDLIDLYVSYVEDESNDEQKYKLFFKGYIRNIPEDIVFQNIQVLDKEKCIKIFNIQSENKKYIKEILQRKIANGDINTFQWVYELARDFFNDEDFLLFDREAFEIIEQAQYFKLWEKKKGKILPKSHIEKLLEDDFNQYSQIERWIKDKVITQEEIGEFLFSYLQQQISIVNRREFYKQFSYIKYLVIINEHYSERIKHLKNDFYSIILWFLNIDEEFNFELLKGKFIYFSPDEQIGIIRKLFFLKVSGKFDLTIEKLEELKRFDLDLYNINLNFNTEIPIDLSTDVVIQALISYKEKQRFCVESELLKVVLEDLRLDKTRRFKLAHYFENCLGRLSPEFNWERNGEIFNKTFGETQFYYAITISAGEHKYIKDRRVDHDSFVCNPHFEELKEAVKLLPGRKWNKEYEHWGVPSRYGDQVIDFAKKYRFFLNFDGSVYENNTHLADFKRTFKQKKVFGETEIPNIPNGIQFCEGRLANKPDNLFKKEFWWCMGEPCFSKCETIHSTKEWDKYTLLDFCEILGFNTDETNNKGELIPKGYYYQFIGLINRFNRLLNKLYCRDCDHILHPMETSHFAAYTVVRFHCTNEKCLNNDIVYLNHCLNGKCNNIIDSRDSKKCVNGLFICDSCGSCCSHDMLNRRLNNLILTGGLIHENLKIAVDEKLGHLERGDYFCYKCGKDMKEEKVDIFYCPNCNVRYDTTRYKFKRLHKYLSKKKQL